MNIELHKFFKDMFNIDIINDDIDKISFPTFEEVLGLIDLAEQRRLRLFIIMRKLIITTTNY